MVLTDFDYENNYTYQDWINKYNTKKPLDLSIYFPSVKVNDYTYNLTNLFTARNYYKQICMSNPQEWKFRASALLDELQLQYKPRIEAQVEFLNGLSKRTEEVTSTSIDSAYLNPAITLGAETSTNDPKVQDVSKNEYTYPIVINTRDNVELAGALDDLKILLYEVLEKLDVLFIQLY